ncbi:MAG: hypothetical protein ABFD69_00015 [Candidatus Sumerlaeia bacterium]
MIQLSQMQLENFWIDELSMRTPSRSVQRERPNIILNMGARYQVEKDDPNDPLHFWGILNLTIKPTDSSVNNAPEILLKITGEFRIHPEASEDSIKNYETISAPSMLYGVCRGVIATTMSLSTLGKMVIPSVGIRSFMPDLEKRSGHSANTSDLPPETPRRRVARRKK